MDAFAMNCEVMETPGPGAYQVGGLDKIGGGKFSNAHPMSDIDWTISRYGGGVASGVFGGFLFLFLFFFVGVLAVVVAATLFVAVFLPFNHWSLFFHKQPYTRAKTIPGPGQYPQPPLQLASGGRFSTAKPKGELDWIVYRSKHIPGPSKYGTPELVKMESGVLFGPEEGPAAYTRPRPMTAPQKLKMEAESTLPGPGSYKLIDSVGRQVESMKASPARVSFGSGTRGQRRKIYMGHG